MSVEVFHVPDIPIGIRAVRELGGYCCRRVHVNKDLWYRVWILLLTFLAYTSYHLSRKPISVVKNVLNQNCSNLKPPADMNITDSNRFTWCDWAPFGGADSETLLGTLDSSFLFAYAIGMFFSGVIAERVNLRYFLALGMMMSGIFTYLFGIAFYRNIHSLFYFIFIQAVCGLFQTSGWPGVVTIVGNWFGKGKRGFIFGVWNSHTSLGNILGSVIAGAYVEYNWGLSFIVPGLIVSAMGFLMWLFMVTDLRDVGCTLPDYHGDQIIKTSRGTKSNHRLVDPAVSSHGDHLSYSDENDGDENELLNEDTPILHKVEREHDDSELPIPLVRKNEEKAIGFMAALKIPGVVEFSFSLFFSKLVSYTFLYWLPRYIKASTSFSSSDSANLSTLFDVGGIIGGIFAGAISDYSGMSATTCSGMLIIAVPMLLVYENYGAIDLDTNIALLMIVGLLVNGPYALITTAVSAELGTHKSLRGNSKAIATVSAIIDGTGSVGAALGPLIAGPISDLSWDYVFYMLMIADVLSLLLLLRLVKHEIQCWQQLRAQKLTVRKRLA